MSNSSWRDNIFFGLHFDMHANVTDTELGSGLTKEGLIEQLIKVRPDFVQCDCKGHAGYTSYPTKVGVTAPHLKKDCLRIWRDATRELGIPLVMHYSGVFDVAAIERHNEWGRVDPSEYKHGSWTGGSTVNGHNSNMTCPMSDYTRDYMAAQMVEIIREYDGTVFGWMGRTGRLLPVTATDAWGSSRLRRDLALFPMKMTRITIRNGLLTRGRTSRSM